MNDLLFCAHTLWLNYVTVTFLLVNHDANHDVLRFVQDHGQKSEQKHRTKNFNNYQVRVVNPMCLVHTLFKQR